MKDTLGEQLIGTWKLESRFGNPVAGSVPVFHMGEAPMSIIMYTQDGYMSAQLMRCGRQNFASGD